MLQSFQSDGEIFYSLREAQIIIERWRNHYNIKRPHSALGYRPPLPEAVVPMGQRQSCTYSKIGVLKRSSKNIVI